MKFEIKFAYVTFISLFFLFVFTSDSFSVNKLIGKQKSSQVPPILTLDASDYNGYNISCYGDSDGSIDLTITSGLPPFDILWSNGEVNEDIDSLIAGNYSVRVIDANNDTVFSNIDLIQPDSLIITIDSTANILCYGGNNGFIGISISGGVPTYGFLWSDASNNEDLQNVVTGNYSIIITDLNGCSQSASQIITQPDSLQISFSSQDETCGNENGNITTTITGGTNPFSFLWSNAETTSAISNLQAGTYTLIVTDSNFCIMTDSISIVNFPGPTITVDSVLNEQCFGDANGNIYVTVSGGTGTLNYLWSDGNTNNDLQNVVFGTYTVTVTDINLCTTTVSASITQPAAALSVATASTNSTCGNANGTATATPAGGTPGYTYLWSDGQTAQIAISLAAITYTVTVTDANGCASSASQTISNTAGPSVVLDSIYNENCFGDSNGNIFVTASGGTGALNYIWSDGNTNNDLQNVVFGTYTVTITDVNLCTATLSATITQPTAALSVSTSSTNSTCGNANGTATATASGGTSGYSYLWSDGQTTQIATLLSASTYSVVVTDNNSCTIVTSETVSDTPGPVVTVFSKTDVSCYGFADGAINVNTNNGTPPFSYLWSGSETTEDISNLSTGNYTITVTDFNLCTSSTGEFVDQPDSISISMIITPALGIPNGSIVTSLSGGTPGYSYLWSTGATTTNITGLYPGTYTLTVTDINACTSNRSGVVSSGVICSVSVDSTHNTSCYNGTDGSVYITLAGAFAPLIYTWSNGSTIEDINGLSVGTYTVTVTDFVNCSTSTSATITQPDSITLSFTSSDETCGNANGSITANISGGTNPYSMLWSTSATTQTINNISAGTYTLTISDGNLCIKIDSVTILNFANPFIILDSVHNETCFGDANGDIFVTASGGTGTLSYLWSDASTLEDLQNVVFGTYTITVTDINFCTATLSAAISQPAGALSVSTSSTNSNCGNANGTATATPSGGTASYTYFWSNGQTTQTATGLSASTYTVTVTDANGCTSSHAQVILNNSGPSVVLDSIQNEQCFGDANGDIFVTASGGTGSLNYLWSNGNTNSDLQNVVFGNYTVTVTDVNSCTATLSAIITQPVSTLSVTTSSTNSTCGNANGTTTATPAGGTAGYNYLWSNGQTTQIAIGLSASTFTVTVTDANGCTSSDVETVSNTFGPSVVLDSIHHENCFGDANGDIFISVTGGTGTMNYLWSGATTTADLQNVIVGIYTVTVTDGNNCTATLSAAITQPSQLIATTSSNNSTCGNANGYAITNPSGGVLPYSYLWSNSQTTQTATGLIAATYTVTVTDNNSCSKVANETVSDTPGPSLSATSVNDADCYGNSDGSINLTVSNGTSPFSYLWSNTATTEDISNLPQGNYTVTVTDFNSCTSSIVIVINQPDSISISTNMTPSGGGANGALATSVTGGTSPFSYLWSTGASTDSIGGLIAGLYELTVTDNNSCTSSRSTIVTTGLLCDIAVDSVIPPYCFSGNDGSIYISLSGMVPPITYQWSNGATTEDITNLVAGTYSVTVSDLILCTVDTSIVVIQPDSITVNFNTTNEACNSSNGSITANPSGGTGSYSYLWSTTATTQTISNLSSGTYTVTISDTHSCTKTQTSSIINVSGPTLILDSIKNVKCFGDPSGSIFINVTGGTTPFNYLWSDASTSQDLISEIAGTYTVVVSDSNSCTDTLSATINQPTQLNDSTTTASTACGGSTGNATVWPYGGTGPYTFLWSTTATTQTITSLISGPYTVTVTDANNCIVSSIALVNNIGGPVITLDSIFHVRCNGESNGGIFITPSGGTPGYTYFWSNGNTTQDNPNVPAGIYFLVLQDANNCIGTFTDTVFEPGVLNDSIVKVNETCGQINGSASVYPYGGTSPYLFQWSNGETTQTIDTLSAGTYTVTITDAHLCTKISSVIILNLSGPSITIDSVKNAKCFGDNNGAVYISITNGTIPYSYLWSNGTTTQYLINVIANTYTITVTDNNGCTEATGAVVNQPDSIAIGIITTPSVCGVANGIATASAAGGQSPYTYLWSTGATAATITGLLGGPYTVTATDANGCKDSVIAIVPSVGGATIILDSIVDVKCFGQSNGAIYISLLLGTPPFTYTWSNGATTQDNINIPFGNYTVFVFDANNCFSSQSFTVIQPDILNDSITKTNETCGSGNGSITVHPFGGTSPYTYLWSNTETTQTINNLTAGSFTVTVTDFNGCTESSSTAIINTAGPSLADSVVNVKCFGGATGTIYITVSGGTSPYSFMWSNSATTQNIVNVIAGNYSVVVTDFHNCMDTLFATITEPTVLDDSISVTNETCGTGNGVLTVNPLGGTSPYTFVWSNGETTATVDSLSTGTYTITITDFNNCTKTSSATIINIPGLTINLDSLINVKCFGESTGAIYVSPIGGTPLYSFLWSNSQTTSNLVGIPSGTYTVSITDANDCKDSSTYTLTQPSQLLDTISITNSNCGLSNGLLIANPYGGIGPYTFLWSTLNADTTQTIDSLFASTYTVTITDANGCSVATSATISDNPGPIITVDSIINVKCNGDNTGAIYISVSSGTTGYDYLWSNGFTTQNISNLSAGTYTLIVTDTNLCATIDSASITEPVTLADSVITINATCGDSNGVATIYPYGGTPPYTYLWFDGQTTQSIDSLAAGSYTITITDFNNCTHIDNSNISNIGGPDVAIDSVKNISCNGGSDGAIYVTTSNGLPPYMYQWSPGGSTAEDTINISEGTYTLTVTDSANCIKVVSQIITEPDSLILTPGTTPSNCNASTGTATVQITGGTLPYAFLWSNGQTTQAISGISTGIYTVTATDAHGCLEDTIAIVITPDAPVISNAVVTNVLCYGEFSGSVNITVTNGTIPYGYLWSNTFPPVTTQDLLNDTAGTYSVLITDAANCTASQTYTIAQPPDAVIDFTIVDPSCNTANGSIISLVTGGTGTFTYLWNNSQTTSGISNLTAGSYTLTVTDGNLCKDSAMANLSNIAAPVITVVDSGMVSCHGLSNGFINVSVTGGHPPYTYTWTNTSQTGPFINNLSGNIYTLTIIDADSCISVRSIVITEPDLIDIPANISLQNGIYNIKCHGGNDGSITIIPTGGTQPFFYLWSYNANQNQNLINIPAGFYTVTVTDANGCTKDSTFELTEPPELISDAGNDHIICGQTTDTIYGNIPTYGTGHWVVVNGTAVVVLPNSPVSPVTNLNAGINNTIQWIVSDDSCSVSSDIFITVNTGITAIPGADRSVCNDSILLAAVPPQFGTGYWKILSGNSILNDYTMAQTFAYSLSPGQNQFLWTVMNGTCVDSAVVTITLRNPEDCLDAIQIPTGITPNGDGKNDVFFVKGLGDYYQNSIIIYNRWGNKVFEQNPYQNDWQGTNQNGALLPEGTYFVILKIQSITKVFTGYIDLRR